MPIDVVVLNGGSSSGTSAIARSLQESLPGPWLRLGVDDLIDALPAWFLDGDAGLAIGQHGEVAVGDGFRKVEDAWLTGVAAMARAGARIIIDDVFLGGAASQERTRAQLAGLHVLWVGVRCDPAIAVLRESVRGDRVTGMAASQADLVHAGVVYDLEVDTSSTPALDCARTVATHVTATP